MFESMSSKLVVAMLADTHFNLLWVMARLIGPLFSPKTGYWSNNLLIGLQERDRESFKNCLVIFLNRFLNRFLKWKSVAPRPYFSQANDPLVFLLFHKICKIVPVLDIFLYFTNDNVPNIQ